MATSVDIRAAPNGYNTETLAAVGDHIGEPAVPAQLPIAAMAKKVSVKLSLDAQHLVEGLALHAFLSTARALNESSKRFAKERVWRSTPLEWIDHARLVVTTARRRKLTDDDGRPNEAAANELWDFHDVLSMLKQAAKERVRSPQAYQEGTAYKDLVFCENVSKVLMLRTWISHVASPPPGNVVDSMEAYASVLSYLGCDEESRELRASMERSRPLFNDGEVCSFPPEVARAAAILTSMHHAESALRSYCQKEPTLQAKLEEEEEKRRKKKQRLMEMDDLLDFLGRHSEPFKACSTFNKTYREPLKRFRNRFFHAEDRLPGSSEVMSSFWNKFIQMLKEVLGPMKVDPLPKERKIVENLLQRTKDSRDWKKLKLVECSIHRPQGAHDEISGRGEDIADTESKATRRKHWISPPQVELVGREQEMEQIVGLMTDGRGPHHILIWGDSGIGKSSLGAGAARHLRKVLPIQHFIRCTAQDTFNNSLLHFATACGYRVDTSIPSDQRDSAMRSWLCDYLQSTKERLLLVMDDLRRQEDLKLLPLGRHSVIVTSLRKDPWVGNYTTHAIHLTALSTLDSLKVLVNARIGGKKSSARVGAWPAMDEGVQWLSLLQRSKSQPQPNTALETFNRLTALLEDDLFNLPLAVEMVGCLLSREVSLDEILGYFMSRRGDGK